MESSSENVNDALGSSVPSQHNQAQAPNSTEGQATDMAAADKAVTHGESEGNGDTTEKQEENSHPPQNDSTKLTDDDIDRIYHRLGIYRCSSCKFTTDNRDLFMAHITTCSKGRKQDKANNVTAKLMFSYTNGTYKCHTCNLTWTEKSKFIEHVLCHISDSPYICLNCKQKFASREQIETHCKTDHPNGDPKCGLMGMKKGGKIVENLMQNQKIKIDGKVHVPHTPRPEFHPSTTILLSVSSSSSGTQYSDQGKQHSDLLTSVNSQANPTGSVLPAKTCVEGMPIVLSLPVVSSVQNLQQNIKSAVPVKKILPKGSPSITCVVPSNETATAVSEKNTSVETEIVPVTCTVSSSHQSISSASNNAKPLLLSVTSPVTSPVEKQAVEPASRSQVTHVNVPEIKPVLNSIATVNLSSNMTAPTAPLGTNTASVLDTVIQKKLVDKKVEHHLNNLFGELNTQTNEICPTTVSTKIQKIVNVSAGTSSAVMEPKYQVKQVTQYTAPLPLPPGPVSVNTSTSNMPSGSAVQGTPFFLIPVGPVIRTVNVQPEFQDHQSLSVLHKKVPQPILPAQNVFLNRSGQSIMPTNSTVPSSSPLVAETVEIQRPSLHPNIQRNPQEIAQTTLTPASIGGNTGKSSTSQTSEQMVVEWEKKCKNRVFSVRHGYGFVCEACKKFTKDEQIFKKHIWDHLHGNPRACKMCDYKMVRSKMVNYCHMVNSVLFHVTKRAAENEHVKVMYDGEKEIIEITDDNENDQVEEIKNLPEVIVLDDQDDEPGSIMTPKITGTFSLVETNVENEQLENKSHKEVNDKTTPEVASTEATQVSCQDNILYSRTDQNFEKGQTLSVTQSEDNEALKTDILNESLSQPDEVTESFVSQVIGTSLKDFDPNNSESVKNIEEPMDIETTAKCHPGSSLSKKSDRCELPNENLQRAFENNLLTKHRKEAFYICGFEGCHFVCLYSQDYKAHLKHDKHKNEYCYVCGHCGQKDYNEDGHVRHMFAHANIKRFVLYKCPVRWCRYRTNVISLYEAHLKAHKQEELYIKCTYCHTTFPDARSLTDHLKKNLLKFVNCPYCSFRFVNNLMVKEHIKLSHPDRLRVISISSQIVCNEREINFYVTQKVKASSQIENGTAVNSVAETTQLDIPALLEEVHNGKSADVGLGDGNSENGDSASLPEADQDMTQKTVAEDSVQKDSVQKVSQDRSMSLIHDFAGPKSLQCPACQYVSYNQSRHIEHMSLHDGEPERDKRFLCVLCPKGFENLPKLRQHLLYHPGANEIRVYCCTDCNYVTNVKSHIMDHCEDFHDAGSMYTLKTESVCSNEASCKYCGFKARNAEHVIQHELQVHKIKPVVSIEIKKDHPYSRKAQTSDQSPKQKSVLVEKDEGKKRKYHCEYCNKFFKHKLMLKEHLDSEHKDIDNKQFVFFKCKYCSYTSTMKEVIVNHIRKKHEGEEVRILRKIETVGKKEDGENKLESLESSKIQSDSDAEAVECRSEDTDETKESVVVPDGNTFKKPFHCPKCSFESTLRVNTIRHLKTHPELKLVRPTEGSVPRMTARKSTSLKVVIAPKVVSSKKRSWLIQDMPHKLENPFTQVKSAVLKLENVGSVALPSPSKDPYVLGEKPLHSSLSACYVQIQEDMKFQCRICQQKIAKKYVLHRHILDHLGVVFFKCKYCAEGATERMLMIGHIQKEHTSQPLEYITVPKTELDNQFKERLSSQNFQMTRAFSATSDSLFTPTDLGLKVKQVLEYNEIDSESDGETEMDLLKEPDVAESEKFDSEPTSSLKCPQCRYVAMNKRVLKAHITAHDNPAIVFFCSGCDYRAERYLVVKHVYRRTCHAGHAKVLRSTTERKEKPIEKKDTYSYEIKTVYKCKVCGGKRDSKSGMYAHFKRACNGPFYQCSLCKFQASKKMDVTRHGTIRHPGKKVTAKDLPAAAKIKIIKIPVKHKKVAELIPKPISKCDIAGNENSEDSNTSNASQNSEPSSEIDSSLKCQLCKTFLCESEMKLQHHINTVHRGVTLLCQKCPYKTPLVKHMMNHCKNVHLQDDALYTSKILSQSVKTETQPDSAMRSEDQEVLAIGLSCPKCSTLIASVPLLKNHLFLHFNYRPYSCKYCSKTYVKAGNVKWHIQTAHPDKEVKYKYLKNESVEGKVEKNVKIAQKNQGKCSRPSFLNNLEMYSDGIRRDKTQFYCDICGKKNIVVSHIKRHIEISHAGIKRPLEVDSNSDSQPCKRQKLDEGQSDCRTSAKPVNTVNIVQKSHNKRYKVISKAGQRTMYKCLKCDYSAQNSKKVLSHHLRKHREAGQRGWQCFYCDYATPIMGNAWRHLYRRHKDMELKLTDLRTKKTVYKTSRYPSPSPKPSTSPARCTLGSKCQIDASVETVYIPPERVEKRSSERVRVYHCSVCGLEARSQFFFRLHLTTHSEFTKKQAATDREMNLLCGYCPFVGANELYMSAHLASHMSDTRYQCPFCGLSTFEKTKIILHCKIVHDVENVFDKKLKELRYGNVQLVNLDPKVDMNETTKLNKTAKSYRRLVSDSESSESETESFKEVVQKASESTSDQVKREEENVTTEALCESNKDNARYGTDISDSESSSDIEEKDRLTFLFKGEKETSFENASVHSDTVEQCETQSGFLAESEPFIENIESQPFEVHDCMEFSGSQESDTDSTAKYTANKGDNTQDEMKQKDADMLETLGEQMHQREHCEDGNQSELTEKNSDKVRNFPVSSENQGLGGHIKMTLGETLGTSGDTDLEKWSDTGEIETRNEHKDHSKKNSSVVGETSKNIFEQISEQRGRSVDSFENKGRGEKNWDKTLFEKFGTESVEKETSDKSSNADGDKEHDEGTNIFEKFGMDKNDKSVASLDSPDCNEENIFDKMTKISSGKVDTKIAAEDKNVEDMEVDELIRSIDQAMEEESDISKSGAS